MADFFGTLVTEAGCEQNFTYTFMCNKKKANKVMFSHIAVS